MLIRILLSWGELGGLVGFVGLWIMDILSHALIFLLSAGIIWFFAGLLIDVIVRIAKRFHQNGFTVAFFVLGLFTSISELSVAVNASLGDVPQVSVGNLVGASFVIILFIVPLLAVAGNGVELKKTLSAKNLLLALGVIGLPSLLVIDGGVTKTDGLIALSFYIMLIYSIRSQTSFFETTKTIKKELGDRYALADWIKVILGGVLIFGAGRFLVGEVVYFATLFNVPSSIIGLILLSVGTNVPELVIAIRSISKKRRDIAFGDYLGSAATNTPIFALVALANGSFAVESVIFAGTFFLTVIGFALFFILAQSGRVISKKEGLALLVFYLAFLALQVFNFIRFSQG